MTTQNSLIGAALVPLGILAVLTMASVLAAREAVRWAFNLQQRIER